MKTALFFNFTDKPFTGYWDGKGKTFKPGEKVYMPDYLAKHYAKHLTNFVLLEQGKENYTSPKHPEQVPMFMDIFNKACIVEDDADQTEAELATDIAQKTHEASTNIPISVDNKPVQIIEVPDDEDEFEGLKESPVEEIKPKNLKNKK